MSDILESKDPVETVSNGTATGEVYEYYMTAPDAETFHLFPECPTLTQTEDMFFISDPDSDPTVCGTCKRML